MSAKGPRVLYVTSECTPWSKTGGLADVSASLPAALRTLGADVRVLMPAYSGVPAQDAESLWHWPATDRLPAAGLLSARLPSGPPALLVQSPLLYARRGGPYQNDANEDWADNAVRFAQLCRIAADLGQGALPTWRPQVVHCNDWQTGPAVASLHFAPPGHAATVMTIHNLAFQGLYPPDAIEQAELPPESYRMEGAEFYGQYSFLKAGVAYADAVTTVSPTYAREIQTEAMGMGFHGLLSHRRSVLQGILNGIDILEWDPARDPFIARRYDSATLDAKAENKQALQERLGLPASDRPLLAMVARLTGQKGVDLVAEIAPALAALPAQLVVLGRGEPQHEERFAELARRYPESIGTSIAFDEALAHQVEAGADIFLMPSRFEPCGMNQMYSQRYGTVPVVRSTGGLADSVTDYGADGGTGFVFADASASALMEAVRRAVAVFAEPVAWRRLQLAGMARDFSWDRSAREYLQIYKRLAAAQRKPARLLKPGTPPAQDAAPRSLMESQ
jgi:starch synthase